MKRQLRRLTAFVLALSMSMSLLSANSWAGKVEMTPEEAFKPESASVELAEEVEAESTEVVLSTSAISGNWYYTVENGSACITRYNGVETDLVIPAEIDGYSVTSIGVSAFYNCTSLTSVTIPNGVTSIGGSAFNYCTNLKSVTILNGVTSIGNFAFYNCTSLTNVTIPKSVTSIGEYAFEYCTSLMSIAIPNSVTSISNGVFEECTSLKNVTIPNDVTSIGEGAFEDCKALTNITIPNGVTSIGSLAFWGCTSLKSVTIPKSVTSFGNFVFRYCEKLTIYGVSGSTAQKYAKANGIPFKTGTSTSGTSTLKKQPLKVSPTSKTYKVATVKKKAQSFTIKATKAQGKVTYQSSNTTYVTVTSKGKVTVKKGTPKSKYTVTVTAAGNKTYAKGSKTVTITVK